MSRERIEQLLFHMKRNGLQAVVLRNPENVLFATGYWPITGWTILALRDDGTNSLLIPRSELDFLGDAPVDEVIELPMENLDEVQDPYRNFRSFFRSSGIRAGSKVGVELTMETLATIHTGAELSFMGRRTLDLLIGETNSSLVDLTGVLMGLRMTKTERELRKISIACEIAGMGLQEGLSKLREGVSESELASVIEAAVSSNGIGYKGTRLARGFAYVMSGPNGSRAKYPFNVSSNRRMRPGEPVLVELNVQADGLWADLTRTWFIGKPPAELQRYHDVVRRANEEAVRQARAGMSAKELDSVARGVVSSSGLGASFNHRLGHGIGFRLHEPPTIHPASDELIARNMVFTIEPGVYGEDYGIRIEDVVAVWDQESKRLSTFHHDPFMT